MTVFSTAPGSDNNRTGNAKFRKQFLYTSIGCFLSSTLSISTETLKKDKID